MLVQFNLTYSYILKNVGCTCFKSIYSQCILYINMSQKQMYTTQTFMLIQAAHSAIDYSSVSKELQADMVGFIQIVDKMN